MKTITNLPKPIADYIDAQNRHDAVGILKPFTDDALVNDIMRDFQGISAIKGWSDKEIIGVKVTMKVDTVREHYGDFIVTALIDGNYDKKLAPDPLYLDYHFFLSGNKISTLIIIKNTKKSFKK
jgi:ketosteroid isomerase-like protein